MIGRTVAHYRITAELGPGTTACGRYTALASPCTESAGPDACKEKLTPLVVPNCSLCQLANRVGPISSVRGRPLHAVDYEHLGRQFAAFQLEAELLLNGPEDRWERIPRRVECRTSRVDRMGLGR